MAYSHINAVSCQFNKEANLFAIKMNNLSFKRTFVILYHEIYIFRSGKAAQTVRIIFKDHCSRTQFIIACHILY